MAHIVLENAISFLTASIRLRGKSELMSFGATEPAKRTERWDVAAYERLLEHLSPENRPRTRLIPFDELALTVRERSKSIASPILERNERQQYGILDYHRLTWPHTLYLPQPETSTVLAFFPTDAPTESDPSHWREFLLDADTDSDAMAHVPYDELAAVFNLLGLQALRRTLVSVSAQRRLYRIALPWGRFRFKRRDEKTSCEYLLVPVLTLLEAGRTVRFRRTVSLTMFLLQKEAEPGCALTSFDLARLCHQSVWLHRRPRLPELMAADSVESGFAITGPMESFLSGHLTGRERTLPELFDVTFRKAIKYLGVESEGDEAAVKSRIAISRMRSAIFGTALHLDGAQDQSVWEHLTSLRADAVADVIGSLLSVHAGREGREWLIDGNGLRLANIRITNVFEEDTKQLALYNPISRFLLCIIPKSAEDSRRELLSFGVSWLNLLAVSVCTVKEILRSYRHEIEVRRTDIVSQLNQRKPQDDDSEADAKDDDSNLAAKLNVLHVEMLTARDEVDVIYGLELVGQQYASAYARVLDMENVPHERDRLLREIDFAGEMLRVEEAHQLSRKIARSAIASERSARATTRLSEKIAESASETKRLSEKIAESASETKRLSEKIAESAGETNRLSEKIAESTDSTDFLTWVVVALSIIAAFVPTNNFVEAWQLHQTDKLGAWLAADVVLALIGAIAVRVIWNARRNR